MIDLIQLQDDLFGLLMAAPSLHSVNIVQERRFLMDSQVELDTVWQTVRHGRSGNGILIEIPKATVNSPNVSGPPQDFDCPIVCFQNGDAAFTPETGSGHHAENLAQLVQDLLHHQAIIGIGQLQSRGSAAATDYDFINAHRVTLRISGAASVQTPRCATLQYTNVANSVVLTCATSGAEIFYTLDGSTPMDPTITLPVADLNGSFAPVNPNAVRFAGAFWVQPGQRLRAVATAFGFNPSEIINKLIP